MSTRIAHKRTSHLTLWLGLVGAIVVIVGWIFFGYAQGQKKEKEKMNHSKAVPSDAELRSRLTKDQYRVAREGDTETPFQNALDITKPEFMSILSPANRSSARSINSIAARARPVSPSRFRKNAWWKKGILPMEWSGLKFAQAKVIRTSVTCSTMARRQLVNATLSIRPRCVLFPWRS